MSIKVESIVKIHQKGEKEITKNPLPTLSILSHSENKNRVILKIGDASYGVFVGDLEKAVANAKNAH